MILYGFNETVNKLFDKPITEDNFYEAEELFEERNLNWSCKEKFWKIIKDYGGFPPIKIDALLDGTYVPANTPFVQIMNTAEGFGELVSWYEGALLHPFFPSGCASEAFNLRCYLERTKCSKYKFHSFAWRSYNSMEDAYWGSNAWNLFLFGTDDCSSFKHTAPVVTSIAALAHKVVQQFDSEIECYRYAIEQMAGKPVSMVIDTYNPDRFIDQYQDELMELAMKHETIVVFRPDSGNVRDQAERIMMKIKEFKNPIMFNIIIGDDMNREKCVEYDRYFESLGFDISRFVYGLGAQFHRHVTRDYMGWAMKTSYSNGRPRMKFSADEGKMSLPGVVNLINVDGVLTCEPLEFNHVDAQTVLAPTVRKSEYKTIYLNNEYMKNYRFSETWDDIKSRVDKIDYNKSLQGNIVYSNSMLKDIEETKAFINTV